MKNGVRVSIKDTGPLRISPRLALKLDVGILPEDGAAQHPSGLSMAELGAVHEYGSSAANVPARSWLRTWADLHLTKYRAQVIEEVARMVRTQKFQENAALTKAVQGAARSIKARILGGHITPKDAKATLRRKAPEKRPLVESKEFVNAIHAHLVATFGGRKVDIKSK